MAFVKLTVGAGRDLWLQTENIEAFGGHERGDRPGKCPVFMRSGVIHYVDELADEVIVNIMRVQGGYRDK